FASDMRGSKAEALDAFAARSGRAFTRFDYSGHGASGGTFAEGTISRWLEEARAVFAATEGPQVVVGSSMGGWLALLLTESLKETGRVAGLVLIAPAVDMTRTLMLDEMTRAQRKQLADAGAVTLPSDYSAAGYTITRALIEDGERHLFGERLIETGCPVHILQGVEDSDVPWQHATALVSRLASDDVVLTLVKDGDHRLSRPEDLERMIAAVEGVTAME
ncbi:MAG: alpha/beta hydrolase, partial [Rhizobiales bacterium]|nr:alpha/beta hydrolase [Hyphomicrobiales bacterium]